MAKIQWENAYSLINPRINAEGVHVWPFDPAFPMSVRFYIWDKRHHIRMNRHDYCEIFYVHHGDLICRIQDRRFHMQSGDLVVISNTQYHTIQAPAKGRTSGRVRAAALYFMPELVRAPESPGEDAEYLLPFLMQGADFPHVVAGSTGIPVQVFDLIKRAHTEQNSASTRARLAMKTYLKMILILLVNHYAELQGTAQTFERRQRAIEQLAPLFDFLESRFMEPVSVAKAAKILHLSEPHFMRLFKQVTGQSFINYLNNFRVAKAEHLLASTDLSVSEVSQAVGFCDQSYFGLIFRRMVQLTPLQYKRQFREVK